ncbi:molybdate ABC transporter substrate-binding protein [Actinotalea sp. K2]|uniref:molybdate ABC transporter substrate-binding protein n=1 Tax=Actinotalea sp. K2 TaxID=2939438 RepID=UPI0020171196|nr:molybdate ABC transporter substrate-binding protein [Actinotalea sp. K2]MCL3862782.1 molybdate ABC transporter substrate-binding protein [Actinotalea sp. K2]
MSSVPPPPPRRRRPRGTTLLALLALLLAGTVVWSGVHAAQERPSSVIDPGEAEGGPAPARLTPTPAATPVPSPAETRLLGEITVFAAASLADAFFLLVDAFEAEHPDVTVQLELGPSSRLADRVAAGVPVDVLATADPRTTTVALDGLGGRADQASPVVFAGNSLALAVPAGNPGQISSLEDLARPEVTFAVCEAQVPCGALARTTLEEAGITRSPHLEETDVTAVMARVLAGEVDAGVVYASDVTATSAVVLDGSVRAVGIPDRVNTTTSYLITALPTSTRPRVSQAFVDHVLSPRSQQVLRDAGLTPP